MHDVTEQKRNEERLAEMALHDPLTGLANRAEAWPLVLAALSTGTFSGKPAVTVVAPRQCDLQLGRSARVRALQITPEVVKRRFLEEEVLPWVDMRRKELANRPLIREQAFGDALDPNKLERLGRYEVHLDRKFERVLAMLLRLKDLREGTVAG